MKYIIQALKFTYHTERKAYPELNDMINMLDQAEYSDEYYDTLVDVEDMLHDINLPTQEKPIDDY